ncbi:MmpS family transport accessory protein [Flavobacterium panacagri]|uniref:MmpS family transport accessory protein n=1 Tax=Flavobacterium panacagri TaxID=3034146 RepID=UPI0025A5F688|nr:MmpS family transport accessory protein [Flavobacterium panacagri]
MKAILKTFAIVLTLAFTAVSCSSDNDDKKSGSRDIRYEVSGNYTGKISATYTESGNGGQAVDINSLPWSKEFTASSDTYGAGITLIGTGGVVDQTLTVKIIVGGKVEKETTAKATSDGSIIAAPGSYVFPL